MDGTFTGASPTSGSMGLKVSCGCAAMAAVAVAAAAAAPPAAFVGSDSSYLSPSNRAINICWHRINFGFVLLMSARMRSSGSVGGNGQ